MTDDVMARVGGRGCGGAVAFVWGVGRLVRADRFGRGRDHWDRWPAPRFARRVALERGLAAELTDHLGYERGESAPSARPNTRNGTTAKTVDSEVGPFETGGRPRGRTGSFTPRLVRKGQRRPGRPGFDDHQLVRPGMTVRDIRHHLASTIGAASERGRSPKITDAVCDAVLQWQRRPLEAFYPVIYPGRDPRPRPRADHQVSNRAAHIAVGAAVDGLLSTCWASGSKPMRGPPSGPTCAPNCPTGACRTC